MVTKPNVSHDRAIKRSSGLLTFRWHHATPATPGLGRSEPEVMAAAPVRGIGLQSFRQPNPADSL